MGATEHLITHGHTRIALLTGGSRVNTSRRRSGWEAALSAAGLAAPEEYVVPGGISRGDGYSSAATVLTLNPPPTAVIVEADALAVGFLRATRDRGLAVPRDISIVSLEGTDLARFAIPSLTSIRQPMQDIASLAVKRVLESDGPSVRRVDLPDYELIPREGCGHLEFVPGDEH